MASLCGWVGVAALVCLSGCWGKYTSDTKENNVEGSTSYQLIHNKLSFFEAEVYCELHGGHIASIHSRVENNAVHNLCEKAHQDCWIGMTMGDRGFQWVDNTPITYINWHSGEPDNWNNTEKCAKMLSQYHDGTWSDQSCDADYAKAYFVCKSGRVLPTSPPSTVHTAVNVTTTPRETSSSYPGNDRRLTVSGSHFQLGGQRVFLSGINQAWVAYAYDFGNAQYQYRRAAYEATIVKLAQSGGNSIRVWIHIEGETSPQFGQDGHVTGTDEKGTLISDLRTYIRFAAQHNILVFPTLWNAAVKQSFHYRLDGLIKDTSKLQSYINLALVPMVTALKDEPGLGGWDIINEFEGELIPGLSNSEPCFDTTYLQNSGAGWAGKLYTAQEFLRFINWQVDAIRRADPQAQVTAGAWSPRSVTDSFGLKNLYKDDCLRKAGMRQMGTLTFYSVHSYDWNQHYDRNQPFLNNYTAYNLDKPLVIAEFNQKQGGGMTMSQQFGWAYHHGYTGAWSWSYTDESWSAQSAGLNSIKQLDDQNSGGLVHFGI